MTGTQQAFWDKPVTFDGDDYDHEKDYIRLKGQMMRIYNFMKDGHWDSLKEIARHTGDPETSVSAQLRNFRKERFGGHTMNKERAGDPTQGFYLYQLKINENAKMKTDE